MTKNFMDSYNALVIAGASGSGKSTIVKHLLHRYPNKFLVSISYTTRSPREKEKNGVDYHFISHEKFEEKIKKNEFIEYAEYAGYYYGTGVEYLKVPPKKILLLEIEKKGVKNIKKTDISAAYVYIYAPLTILHERISQRAIITQDELSKRLMKAKEENLYGCSSEFNKVISNTTLEEAIAEIDEYVEETFKIK